METIKTRKIEWGKDEIIVDEETKCLVIVPHDNPDLRIRISGQELWNELVQLAMDVAKLVEQKYHEITNIELPDGSMFHWNVDPQIAVEQSKASFKWVKQFEKERIEIIVGGSAKPFAMISPEGIGELSDTELNLNFGMRQQFDDNVSFRMDVSVDPFKMVNIHGASGFKMPDMKANFSFTKRF